MWIQEIQLENFKSFCERQTIGFSQGFNIVIGANNAGKSTLLQALQPQQFTNVPHKSISSLPNFGDPVLGQSKIRLTWEVSVAELRQLQRGNPTFLPYLQSRTQELANINPDELCAKVLSEQLVASLELSTYGYRVSLRGDLIFTDWLEQHSGQGAPQLRLEERLGLPPLLTLAGGHNGAAATMHSQLMACSERIYRFDARRFPPVTGELVQDGRLDSAARNLPGCLNWIQTNDPEGHRQLCEWVHRVLPHVYSVQAPPSTTSSHSVELRCHPRPAFERRNDLSVPISEMGAGVGNVVALLYVVLTARHPQVICIDEPGQFLHPKALRELLNIIAVEGRSHQYILTAHSAEVIGAIDADTVTLLTLEDGRTRVQQAKHNDLASLRDGLADLGIRATELHGRDRVLWVEGQTEELCFPAVLARFCADRAAGTAVLRVHDTGAFERKGVDPLKVVQIYNRLSTASALVPPMIAIVLDREARGIDEIARLSADRRGKLRFLPRRMLENFVLHPEAIAAVLNEHEAGCCSPETVSATLCGVAGVVSLDQIDVNGVDGARVLATTFADLTEARWEFKKTRDVPLLIDWLIKNDAQSLGALGDWLADLLAEREEISEV